MHTDPDFQSKVLQSRSLFVFVHFQIDMSILSTTQTMHISFLFISRLVEIIHVEYELISFCAEQYLACPCTVRPIRVPEQFA